MGRAPCCLKVGLNRGTWTPEEDALLSRHIEAHGEGCWRNLPKAAGLLRCGKSCRLRWVNYLRPTVRRGNISEDEEDLIIRMHSLLGNRWSLIAARLPGRTDNEIKNYWNTCLRKKLKGINPTTHKILGTSACRKYAKVDQNICQRSLKNSDPECTEKVPYMNIRPGSPDQSGAAISGPHCDRRADGNFNASTIIVSDNELRDVLTEPSSIDSCEVLSKNGKEASSLYGSTRRNNHLQQVKTSDFVITDYSISSPKTVGSFESVQMDQTGPHSRVVREFIECSASKCSSPSSNSTTSTSCSIANVSYLGFTNHTESDNNTKSKERGDFASREHDTFKPKNAMNLRPHTADSEVEKKSNQKEALTESGLFVFPPDSTDPRSIHSGPLQFPEEPIEKDIWNFVDKLSTGEHWEALEPFTHSCEYWNVPGCTTTSSLDFQVNFVDFS